MTSVLSFWRNTKVSVAMTFRDRQGLFWGFGFPLVFAFVFGALFQRGTVEERWGIILQIIAINLAAGGLFGAATLLVTMREQHILRRYRVTPLPLMALLLSTMAAQLVIVALSAVMQIVLLKLLLKVPLTLNWGKFWVAWLAGATALLALGLIAASLADNSRVAPAIVQVLFMPMLFLSGVTIPASLIPPAWQQVGEFMPLTHLFRAFQAIAAGKGWSAILPAILALLLASGVGIFFAHALFRWEPEEKLPLPARLRVVAAVLILLALPKGMDTALAFYMKPRGTVVVYAGRLWDGVSDSVRGKTTVVVRDGRIAEVRSGFAAAPWRARVIDARRWTVLPGLGDAHVHLGADGGFVFGLEKESEREAIERRLRAYLLCGVTMVKSCGDHTDLLTRLRDRERQGLLSAPRLTVVGPAFTAPKGHPTEFFFWTPDIRQFVRQVETQKEAREQLREVAKRIDGVKAVYGGGFGEFSYAKMKRDALAAVIAEAHRLGLKVTVHTDTASDVETAVALGADGIEHGSFTQAIDNTTLQAMAKRKVVFVPTLAVIEGMRKVATGESADEEPLVQMAVPKMVLDSLEGGGWAAMWRRGMQSSAWDRRMSINSDNVRRAHRAGVRIVCGSDAGNFATFHGPALHRELRLLVRAGLPPVEALKAATSRCAEWLGLETGVIASGKLADLIAVDGDPTKDITELTRLRWVMKGGEMMTGGEWEGGEEVRNF